MEQDLKNQIIFESMPTLPYVMEEAVNRLRININFLGSDVKKIMVISSVPNEGKSFVTMQLWRQMAEAGIDSCFVDADLRKSVLVEKYGLKKADGSKMVGFSQYLANDIPLEDVISKTNYEHGDILPNIDNVINPSILLEGDKFKNTLDTLASRYRYVFIDVPPLGVVSDGERIGSICDGAILVARGGETSKGLLLNSARQLERAGCPILGVVLNRVKDFGSGSYYKKYGSYRNEKYYYK